MRFDLFSNCRGKIWLRHGKTFLLLPLSFEIETPDVLSSLLFLSELGLVVFSGDRPTVEIEFVALLPGKSDCVKPFGFLVSCTLFDSRGERG